MKKLVSLLLVSLLTLSLCTPMTFAASEWSARTNDVDLRVAILGDTHTNTTNEPTYSWFKKTVDAISALGSNKLDGLALTGDVIWHEKEVVADNYDVVLNYLKEKNLWDTSKLVYAMGNHEYPLHASDSDVLAASKAAFIEKTGLDVNQHITIGGYHFIAAASENYAGKMSSDTESWLMTEIDKAIAADSTNDDSETFAQGTIPNGNKPVFVTLHHPVSKTIFNMDDNNYTDAFVSYLKTRPQVIVLTGHKHIASQIPDTIWQDGFTVFQTSHSSGGDMWSLDTEEIRSDVHQSSMIEIKNNVVSLVKLDLSTCEEIGEPWVIDIPAIVKDRTDADTSNDNAHYLYSADKRTNPVKPSFPNNAEIDADVDGCSAKITWTNNAVMEKETTNQQDDFIRAYKIEICDSTGKVLTTKTIQADYYTNNKKAEFSVDFGLGFNTSYTAKVYPIGGLGSIGDPISVVFTTDEDVVSEGSTRYEIENYTTYDIKSSTKASGGKYVGDTWAGPDAIDIEFTFTTETEDYYNLSYAMGQQLSSDVSRVTVYLDGTVLGINDASYTKNISNLETYPWSSAPMRLYEHKNVKLTAAEHTVKFSVAPAGGARKYFIDYFDVTMPQDRVATGNKAAIIEFEDYAPAGVRITEDPAASGGKLLANDYSGINPTTTVNVTVADAGYYNVEFVIGQMSTADYSLVNMYMDGELLSRNRWDWTGNLDTTFDGSKYKASNEPARVPMVRYIFKDKWLEEGVIPIKVEVSAAGSTYRYKLDYAKVTPCSRETVSADVETVIEAEDYLKDKRDRHYFPSDGTTDNRASGGKMINSGYFEQPSLTIPLTVEKSGYYDVEYVGGQFKSSDYSKWDIKLDDVLIGANTDSDPIADYSELGFVSEITSGMPLKKFRKNAVWIEKGSYILSVNFTKVTDHYGALLDYIKFIPKDTPSVSLSKKCTVEFEDYVTNNSYIAKDSFASGGKLIKGFPSGSSPIPSNIIVNVEEAGMYNIEMLMGYSKTTDYGRNIVSVGGNRVFYSTLEGSSGYSYSPVDGYTNHSSYMPMYKFTKTNYRLEKGENKINVIFAIGFKFNLDYIKITPVDVFTVSGSTVSITGNYDKPVSGVAVLACYLGDNLVEARRIDVTEETDFLTINATVTKAFDKAKLLVWKDLVSLEPLARAKEFNNN